MKANIFYGLNQVQKSQRNSYRLYLLHFKISYLAFSFAGILCIDSTYFYSSLAGRTFYCRTFTLHRSIVRVKPSRREPIVPQDSRVILCIRTPHVTQNF